MGLPELLSALDGETDAEVRRELEAAHSEAARIAEECTARTRARRDELLSSRESELRRDAEEAVALARREARRTALASRQSVLDRIFAAAHAMLASGMTHPDIDELLRRDIERGLSLLGEANPIVRCAPALAHRVRAIVAKRAKVEVDPAVPAGVEIVSGDRRVRVDQTASGRLERMRDEIAIALAARMGVEAP